MYLNCNTEPLQCFVRSEFLYNLEAHAGELIPCIVFGVSSIQDRALGFHVMTNLGAQFARLPIHALCWKLPQVKMQLDELQMWNCLSMNCSVTKFSYLKNMRCQTRIGMKLYDGSYVQTIDWAEGGFSETPNEHKSAHMIKLDNGYFALQPNNRIFWKDASFISRPLTSNPGFKINTHEWICEGQNVAHEDRYFYEEKVISASVDTHSLKPEMPFAEL